MLDIEAGIKSAIIIIEDIPQDRFGFVPGDRKIIVSLLDSSNSLLGSNLIYTHTFTDDPKEWTDPNANYFCISDFDNFKLSVPQVANQQDDYQNPTFADTYDEAGGSLNTEQLKSAIKEWALDPVKVTADGELKEAIGDWSVWIDGEFGELTLGKTLSSPRILDERSFHIGMDKLSGDDRDLFGFALGLGAVSYTHLTLPTKQDV